MDIASMFGFGLGVTLLAAYCTVVLFISSFYSLLGDQPLFKCFFKFLIGIPLGIVAVIIKKTIPEKWHGNMALVAIFLFFFIIIGVPTYLNVF